MARSKINYFPVSALFIVTFFLLVALLIVVIEFDVIQYAYEKIGIHRRYVFALLVLSLLGSYVNIPIGELPETRVFDNQTISFFGVRYVIPVVHEQPKTVLAINLGGAVIPVLLSAYLVFKHDLLGRTLLAVAVVTLVVHWMARPLKGVGIAVPMFIPPAVAAATALLISPDAAPVVAYIAGTIGTLIGADLLNLKKLRGLGAPVASIGGAGTFDGIFLAGIIAVLLT
ncbi:MAG TPA: DUF1614 domain-containing protein, partial [Candidatus Limnocylindrales bacterium]|nr:DUF1614 domain-containing protein [Candidatus Limnocylindrales bacterium]